MARKYDADGSFKDYDDKGSVIGGGLKGTENLSATNYTGSTSGGSYGNSMLSGLKKAQKNATIAALDKQRKTSLSNLSAEKSAIESNARNAKIQTGVTARQTQRSFDEYMAQRGGASGIAGQGTLMNNLGYQGAMSGLRQQETNALADNARRVSDVEMGYNSDVAGATANAEATYLQNYINQRNADRAFGLQKQTADANNAMTYAQLEEMQNPNSITNQMKQIGLDTARLNYQALPDQLKAHAQKIAQELAMGNISQQVAQLQLDYLPQQLQLGLQQTRAQINAANRSGSSGGGSGSYSSGSRGTYDNLSNANSGTRNMVSQIASALQSGATLQQVINDIEQMERDGTAAAQKLDTGLLRNLANSIPVDNWQYR